MIRQKMICVKLDMDILERLDDYCASCNLRRNRVINKAINAFLCS